MLQDKEWAFSVGWSGGLLEFFEVQKTETSSCPLSTLKQLV